MKFKGGVKSPPPPKRNGGEDRLTGYWWEQVELRRNQTPLSHKGKDFHEMTEEEYYDSLDP